MDIDLTRRRVLMASALAALADGALAQDAVLVQPDSYRVALDNPHVRVLEYRARPGMGVCGSGLHSHPAHLTIPLNDQRVRIRQGGKTVIVEAKAGTPFWSEAETHETENMLGTDALSLIVELKHA